MTEPKKTLAILSVSAGAGHVRAAEGLQKTAERTCTGWNAVHLDVMDFVPQAFRTLYAESYIKIVNSHPALWGFLYEKSDRVETDRSKLKTVRLAIERLNTRKLKKELETMRPDAIICTHFLPPELISRLIRKDQLDAPCYVQVTDFDIHGLWIQSHMAGYFAASEEVAYRIKDRGIPQEKIHVTGIPISPAFTEPLSRTECAAELGIAPDKTTLLIMSGGMGVGGIDELVERLLSCNLDCRIIALAGKNKKLLADLEACAAKYPGKLTPMGFTTTIERVMAASDIAVSKPGGLTTSECMAMGLPMIIISPIPGQEERNADHLLEHGAALKAHDAAGVEFRVKKLLENRALLEAMRKNAARLGRPAAASNVLKIVTSGG